MPLPRPPDIAILLGLDEGTSSVVRRIGIVVTIVLSYASFVQLYERREPHEPGLRVRWTLLAAAAGAASIGLTLGALYAFGFYRLTAFRGWTGAASIFVLIAIAAVMEEVVFRGILFRIAEEHLGTHVALAASAVVFGGVHLANYGARWRVRAPFESMTFGSDVWTGGAFGPEDSVINLVVSAGICVTLWWWAVRRGDVRSART